jgi:Family of unknown function (DUF6064)
VTEWWTYRPSDFVMFSPRTYWRLLEAHNTAWWPAHLVVVGLGLLVVGASLRGRRQDPVPALLLLALLWAAVGWFFHARRYGAIHSAAPAFALAFGVQALLLLAAAAASGWAGARSAPAPSPAGQALMLLALLGLPAAAVLAGRTAAQADVFGVAPDATALFTLGLLLRRPSSAADDRPGQRWRLLCWPIPLLWCLGSGLTLWNLRAADAWVLPLAAAGAAVLALRGWRSGRGG